MTSSSRLEEGVPGLNSSHWPLNVTDRPIFPGRRTFFMDNVKYYGEPVVVSVGIIGNVLAYLVFTRTRLRKVPSVPYLAGLAVTDSGFLLTYFMSSLTYVYRVPVISQVGVCQFGTFTNYVCLFLSMWYLVALTVEKFICVFWPLKKTSLCTVFRAKVVLVSLAVLAVASYSYVIYFFGPDPRFGGACQPWHEFRKQWADLYILDAVVVYVVPLVVVVLLLALMIVRACEYYRISTASEFVSRLRTGQSKNATASVRVTKVVFPVIVLVLLCHLPNSTVLVIGFFFKNLSSEQKINFIHTSQIVRFIMIISFALKIVIYLTLSRSFRQSLVNFKRRNKNKRHACCQHGGSCEGDAQRINMHGCGQQQQPVPGCVTQSDV